MLDSSTLVGCFPRTKRERMNLEEPHMGMGQDLDFPRPCGDLPGIHLYSGILSHILDTQPVYLKRHGMRSDMMRKIRP